MSDKIRTMSNYEVQSHKNGQWVISSIQDDQDEAIYEAQRLLQGKRTTSVRVVQEIYDESADSYRMKVIFRRSRSGGIGGKSKEEDKKKTGKVHKEKLTAFEQFKRDIRITAKKFVGSFAFVILKFTVIIALGIWLLVTLQDIATKL